MKQHKKENKKSGSIQNILNSTDLIKNPVIIGKNLKQLRIISELTIGKVSELTGFSTSLISLVEQGKRSLKLFDLRKLLEVYDSNVSSFLSIINQLRHKNSTSEISHSESQHKTILLDGSRDEKKTGLILLKTLSPDDKLELVELNLPPKSQYPNEFMVIPAEITGYIITGKVLLVFKNDENTFSVGQQFEVKTNIPHHYRNLAESNSKVLLIIMPPIL